MLRFLLRFTYVLCILLHSAESSSRSAQALHSPAYASFNESCSNDRPCLAPLICVSGNRCVCSQATLFWNAQHSDCLYCPPGWIIWKENRCVSLAVPSESSVSYHQANETCQSFSATLYQIRTIDQLRALEFELWPLLNTTFASAVTLFFRLGAWVDRANGHFDEDPWCDDSDSNGDCVAVREKTMKNASLCLSRSQCHAQLLFICDMLAVSERFRLAPLIGALAPVALDLVGNLFGGNHQPQKPADPQQVIIHQGSGEVQPAAQESSDHTGVYIALAIVGVFILLVVCGICIVALGCVGYLKTSSPDGAVNNRSSIASALSYV